MFIPTLCMPVLALALWLLPSLLGTHLLPSMPVVSAVSIGHELARRQVSISFPATPPSQCSSTCDPVSNEISLACPLTACCTTTFELQYYNCLECIGTALHVANYSNYQNSLNLLYTTCVDIGFVLPRMELPGQSNSTSTGSASTAPPVASGGSTPVTSAAVSAMWHIGWAEMWIGAALLLTVAGLW